MPTTRLINLIARQRALLLSIPVVFTLACFWWEYELEGLVWPLGTGLVLAGIAVRVWAKRFIHWHELGPGIMAMSGPYAFVRNPLYLGDLLLLLGGTVLSELMWFLPVMAVSWFAVYSITARSDERRGVAEFGEAYLEYLAAVPRWVPRLHRAVGGRTGGRALWGPILSEARCLLILLPFVAKEVASEWLEPMMART